MQVIDLRHALEQGLISEVDAAQQKLIHGRPVYIKRYHLLLGHSRMDDDEFVLDYFRTKRYVRVDRRITLVKIVVDEDTRMRMLCGEPVEEPIYEPIPGIWEPAFRQRYVYLPEWRYGPTGESTPYPPTAVPQDPRA